MYYVISVYLCERVNDVKVYLAHGCASLPSAPVHIEDVHLVGEVLARTAARNVDVIGVCTAGVREQRVGKSRDRRPLVGREVVALSGAQRHSVVLAADGDQRRRRRDQHKVGPRNSH